jgi:hypothetical protein
MANIRYFVEPIDQPPSPGGFISGYRVFKQEIGKPNQPVGPGYMTSVEAQARADKLNAEEAAKNV